MKADIPDKILINRDEDGEIHHSYWTMDQQLILFENVEYIRKGALIEWLDGMMTKEGAIEGFVGGYDFALKDVINHIDSM